MKMDKIRQPWQNEPFIDNKLNLLTDRLARFASDK
jgi:hypothetical protein